MSFESKKKRLTKIVANKIHEYNEGKNHDLISVGDDIFRLKQHLGKKISAIEKRYMRNIVIRTALKYNKLIFSEFELDARLSMYKHMAKSHRPEDVANLELYTKMREEVDKEFDETIKADKYLTQLKYRFHSVMWLYTDPHYKQITKTTASSFDHLKLTELLEMFDSKTFYRMPEEDIINLCQAVANKYCASLGIKPLPIIFESEKYNAALGSYTRFGNFIKINGDYLTIINKLREAGSENKYIQYKLLQTIIHECRHSFQATNHRTDKKSTFIRNCAHINMHYMNRIYNPQHEYDETFNRYGYSSRLVELDSQNEANQFLLDVSELNLRNADEIRRYVLYSLPEKYKINTSVIKEIRDLVYNYGLPQPLSKTIYENMQILGLTHRRCLTMMGEKIDYRTTNEKNCRFTNNIQMRFALKREHEMREEFFPTLFSSRTYLEKYCPTYGMSAEEYREELKTSMKPDVAEVHNSCAYGQFFAL